MLLQLEVNTVQQGLKPPPFPPFRENLNKPQIHPAPFATTATEEPT